MEAVPLWQKRAGVNNVIFELRSLNLRTRKEQWFVHNNNNNITVHSQLTAAGVSGEIGRIPVLVPVEIWRDRENVNHLLPLMVENIVKGKRMRLGDVHVLVRT